MTRYDLQITDACRSIDLELACIMKKLTTLGYHSAYIEMTPYGPTTQATIHFVDPTKPDGEQPLYSVDVTRDGDLSPVRRGDRRVDFIWA